MSIFCCYVEGELRAWSIALKLHFCELAGIYCIVLARSFFLFNSLVFVLFILH